MGLQDSTRTDEETSHRTYISSLPERTGAIAVTSDNPPSHLTGT